MRVSLPSTAHLLPLWVFITASGSVTPSTNQDRHQQLISSTNSHVQQTSQDLSSIIDASPLLSLHRDLCEVESISNNELAVAELLVGFLSAHNFTVTTQKVQQPDDSDLKGRERWNIFAVPYVGEQSNEAGENGGPKILLTSHIDTVPPFIPYTLSYPSSESASTPFNRSALYIGGRGTVDDKACVATQIYAVLELLATSAISHSDAGLLFVVGEEADGSGMRHFSNSALNKALNYNCVIFGEPTELKLATGHKGITMLTITAHGKAAHSGYPWLGRSANSILIPALAVIDKLGSIPESAGGLPRSEKYGNSTVNIGFIRGGVAANVVPELAVAKISFRLAGGTAADSQDIIRRAVHSVDPENHLELVFSNGYGPVPLDAGVEGFEEMTVNYGTDVPNLEQREGVKRYLYGPGSILVAHGKNEGLSVGDLEEAVEGYKKLILNALGKL
jgi:acetylornithine deacetylase